MKINVYYQITESKRIRVSITANAEQGEKLSNHVLMGVYGNCLRKSIVCEFHTSAEAEEWANTKLEEAKKVINSRREQVLPNDYEIVI